MICNDRSTTEPCQNFHHFSKIDGFGKMFIHAGLECGVFKAAMPHLDIVATGPLYKEMHTANEWLDVPSFDRTYQFILGLLKRLAV